MQPQTKKKGVGEPLKHHYFLLLSYYFFIVITDARINFVYNGTVRDLSYIIITIFVSSSIICEIVNHSRKIVEERHGNFHLFAENDGPA